MTRACGYSLPKSTLDATVEAVCARRGKVTPTEVLGRSRGHRIAHARQEVFAALYDIRDANGERKFSLPTIARPWGMDHTTVLHGIREHLYRIGEGPKPNHGGRPTPSERLRRRIAAEQHNQQHIGRAA